MQRRNNLFYAFTPNSAFRAIKRPHKVLFYEVIGNQRVKN